MSHHSRHRIARGVALSVAALPLAIVGASSAPAHAAPKPTDCTVVKNKLFTQSEPVVIDPVAPGVVTSTVEVSGVGKHVDKVEITTGLQHTFPGDIEMTVTSPEGTIVTLTTDNGATHDNVFDGTVWTDDANPGGQVPYTTNEGLATDHPYAFDTPVAALAPEEPLGAFRDEDPNGTWTLTISDDANGDGGTLNNWSVKVSTRKAPQDLVSDQYDQTEPTAIPAGPAVVASELQVSGAGKSIDTLEVTTALTHTFPGDLEVTLQSPEGTVTTMTTDNGGTSDNIFDGTVWSDKAAPGNQVPYVAGGEGQVTDHAYVLGMPVADLTPEEGFGAFAGEDPNGTWLMTISDDQAGDSGNLTTWSLDITTGTCDTKLKGATVTAKKKQKAGKKLQLKAKAKAGEKASFKATGTVKIKGGKKLKLKKVGKSLKQAKAKKFTMKLKGSKKKTKKNFALIKDALQDKKKVTAKLTVVVTDKRGNKKKIKRTVTIK